MSDGEIYEQDSGTRPGASDKGQGIQPEFVITVDDPQKVGDPIRGYTMYTVHTRVRPLGFCALSPLLS